MHRAQILEWQEELRQILSWVIYYHDECFSFPIVSPENIF